MGSYSGEDSVNIEWTLRIFENFNSLLDNFKNEEKENFIDVHIDKENKIQKFYLKPLDIDIKEVVTEKAANFLLEILGRQEKYLYVDMEIQYSVNGYYDPGCTYGPPENCYPPESDEERTVEYSTLCLAKDISVDIPDTHFNKIYDAFEKEITSRDFTPDDDGDYDYDYDDRDDY